MLVDYFLSRLQTNRLLLQIIQINNIWDLSILPPQKKTLHDLFCKGICTLQKLCCLYLYCISSEISANMETCRKEGCMDVSFLCFQVVLYLPSVLSKTELEVTFASISNLLHLI